MLSATHACVSSLGNRKEHYWGRSGTALGTLTNCTPRRMKPNIYSTPLGIDMNWQDLECVSKLGNRNLGWDYVATPTMSPMNREVSVPAVHG